jgi:hypothetical protein
MESIKESAIEKEDIRQQPKDPMKRPEKKVKRKLKKGSASMQRYIRSLIISIFNR